MTYCHCGLLRGDDIVYALQQGCSETHSVYFVCRLLDDFSIFSSFIAFCAVYAVQVIGCVKNFDGFRNFVSIISLIQNHYIAIYRHYYYSEQITIVFTVQFGCQSIISLSELVLVLLLSAISNCHNFTSV